MKLIKPSEISARILTMLDESDERIIIVSPYVKISKWYKLTKKVNGLKARNVIIEIYVREDPDNQETYRDLDRMALEYKRIPHLHCKFYMNERYGIVTSMNLLLSSEINALEIGYGTENISEYKELSDFYHRYIKFFQPDRCNNKDCRPAENLKRTINSIGEELTRTMKNSWFWLGENELCVSTGRNNYNISINKGRLRITAGLRRGSANKAADMNYSLIAKKIGNLAAMKVDVTAQSGVIKFSGQAIHPLKSESIAGILETEASLITETVIRFIHATDDLIFC